MTSPLFIPLRECERPYCHQVVGITQGLCMHRITGKAQFFCYECAVVSIVDTMIDRHRSVDLRHFSNQLLELLETELHASVTILEENFRKPYAYGQTLQLRRYEQALRQLHKVRDFRSQLQLL